MVTNSWTLRILIIGGSGSGKTSILFNLVGCHQILINIFLYAKDLYEAKYQFLINKQEGLGLDEFNDFRAFIEYSNDMDNAYGNI